MSSSMSSSDTYALIPMPYSPLLESLPDDPQRLFSIDMIVIHNAFIRGLNSIWRTAPLVKPQDEDAFIGYCLAGIMAIEGHHHGEEAISFPYFEGKLEMKSGVEHNIEQHEAFLPGMEALKDYLESVRAKKEKYDGSKARALLEAFAGILTQHLHDEIETITPEKLKVFDDDKEGFRKMTTALEDHIKGQPGKLTVMPFILSHHDISVAPNWPPAPAPIKWFVKNIATLFHRSYWKFSPFRSDGSPQPPYYGSEQPPAPAAQATPVTQNRQLDSILDTRS